LIKRRRAARTVEDARLLALRKEHDRTTKGLDRLLVDEIRLEGNELKIRGSYDRLADAFGMLEKMKLGEVPSFIPDWRARQDLNPRAPRS